MCVASGWYMVATLKTEREQKWDFVFEVPWLENILTLVMKQLDREES